MDFKILFLLKHSNYTIDYQDAKGLTALHYSAIHNRIQSAKMLLKAGADISVIDNDNKTALDSAKQFSNFELAENISLYSEGKPIDSVNCFDEIINEEQYLSDSFEDSRNASFVIDHSSNNWCSLINT